MPEAALNVYLEWAQPLSILYSRTSLHEVTKLQNALFGSTKLNFKLKISVFKNYSHDMKVHGM